MHQKAQTKKKNPTQQPTTTIYQNSELRQKEPTRIRKRTVLFKDLLQPHRIQIGPFQGKVSSSFAPPNPNYPHVQRHLSLRTTPTCRTQLQLSNRNRERERERYIDIERENSRKNIQRFHIIIKLHRNYQTKAFRNPSLSLSLSLTLLLCISDFARVFKVHTHIRFVRVRSDFDFRNC